MTITIRLKMDNAAFEDGGGMEVARIVHKVADMLQYGSVTGKTGTSKAPLRDSNGNTVGSVTVTGR